MVKYGGAGGMASGWSENRQLSQHFGGRNFGWAGS